jgi:hypothetical protein
LLYIFRQQGWLLHSLLYCLQNAIDFVILSFFGSGNIHVFIKKESLNIPLRKPHSVGSVIAVQGLSFKSKWVLGREVNMLEEVELVLLLVV